MTPDDDELGELVDLRTETLHGVEKSANGTSFLVAKSAAEGGSAALLDTDLVRELVAKAEGAEASEPVTVSGSPAAVADMMARVHAASVRKSEAPAPTGLDEVLKAAGEDYVAFVKAKYSAEDKRTLAAKGHAMRSADGTISYPIDDAEDLGKAVHAVGRGTKASHNAIRKYIIGRAKAMGASDQIPDDWAADGSLKEPVAKADLLGGMGSGADPGSPAWEGQDAAAAQRAVEQVLACIPPVKALAGREGAEVGNGHTEDIGDVWDLQAVIDDLTCAAKKLAGFALSERLEAGDTVTKAQPAPSPAAAAAPAPKENAVSETQTASEAGTENVAKADGAPGALTDAQLAEIGRAHLVKKAAKKAARAAAATQTSGAAAAAPADTARVIPGTDTVQAPAQGPDEVAKAQANQLVAALGEVMAPVVKQLGELATQVGAQQERVEKAMARPDDRKSPALNGATGKFEVADRTHEGSPVNSPEFKAVLKAINEIPDPEQREVAQRAAGLAAIKARFGHAG